MSIFKSASCLPENRPSGTRKNQASFPFHNGNPTTFSSIFNFQFSDSMTSAFVSASKPLLPLFHSAISLSLINQAFFLFSRSFLGLEKELGRAWCLGCMEWMQLQKKKQDQTNFFEIHLTLLHVFYVLFHSDTWMGLGGTRTSNYSNSWAEKFILMFFGIHLCISFFIFIIFCNFVCLVLNF